MVVLIQKFPIWKKPMLMQHRFVFLLVMSRICQRIELFYGLLCEGHVRRTLSSSLIEGYFSSYILLWLKSKSFKYGGHLPTHQKFSCKMKRFYHSRNDDLSWVEVINFSPTICTTMLRKFYQTQRNIEDKVGSWRCLFKKVLVNMNHDVVKFRILLDRASF